VSANSEQPRSEHDDEDDDRDHLDGREPELELAIGARGRKIDESEHGHETQADLPDFQHGQPPVHDLRARDRFDADHDDPEVPVHPATDESGSRPEGDAHVFGERAQARLIERHARQDLDDGEHDDAGEDVTEHYGGADGGDRRAAADEHAGADDAADGNHRQVARAKGLGEFR
jgi:hypothetical protein